MSRLNWNSLSRQPLYIRCSLLMTLAIILLGFGYFYSIRSDIRRWKDSQTLELQLKQDLESKQARLESKAANLAQLKYLKNKSRLWFNRLVSEPEIPVLIETIAQAARENDLSLTLLVPQKEVVGRFYLELPLQVTLEGGYSEFLIFLQGLLKKDKLITLHNLSIRRPAKVAKNDVLIMQVLIKLYRVLE